MAWCCTASGSPACEVGGGSAPESLAHLSACPQHSTIGVSVGVCERERERERYITVTHQSVTQDGRTQL